MSEKISLKEAERKVFQSSFADGLWDVMIGCVVLMFCLAPLLSVQLGDFWSSFIFLPFWGLVYLSIWLTRKTVVAPRMGRVSYGPMRRKKLHTFRLVMVVVNSLVLILGLVAVWSFSHGSASHLPNSGYQYAALLGFFALLGFSLAAYILDYPRLYVYGLMLFVAPLVGEWLYQNYGAQHHGYPIVFGICSGVIILTGLVIFARFLKDNPILPVPAEGG